MRPPLDGVVVVTGASSGIGLELARQLAETASTLVLVARRGDRLQTLADELAAARPSLRTVCMPADLGDTGGLSALCDRIASEVGDIDVLVNNAGCGDMSFVEHASWDRLAQMIAVNVTAPTFLVHRFLPGMLARGRGGILNVSSGSGFVWLPGITVYSATKFFLTSFSDSLRAELAGTPIVVTQLCPGPTESEFIASADNTTPLSPPRFAVLSARRCAAAGIAGFSRGRAAVFPGLIARIGIGLGRMTPAWLWRVLTGLYARSMRPRLQPARDRR